MQLTFLHQVLGSIISLILLSTIALPEEVSIGIVHIQKKSRGIINTNYMKSVEQALDIALKDYKGRLQDKGINLSIKQIQRGQARQVGGKHVNCGVPDKIY